MRCPVCDGAARELYPGDGELRRHARCDGCGAVFVDPLPADPAGENEALYGGATGPGKDRSPRHDALLGRLRRGARVLDVGCGAGAFLERAVALGCDATGVDLSPTRAAEAAARAKVAVHAGPLATLPAGAGFDLVRMNQVLEHAGDPRALLAAARERLAPGGEVWLATPNAGSLAHAVLGAGWRQLGRERNGHLVLFDPRTLERLAHAVGLRTRGVRTRGARAWSLARAGIARRSCRTLELLLEPWVRWSGRGAILEARLALPER